MTGKKELRVSRGLRERRENGDWDVPEETDEADEFHDNARDRPLEEDQDAAVRRSSRGCEDHERVWSARAMMLDEGAGSRAFPSGGQWG
jgi:hypothetical protein